MFLTPSLTARAEKDEFGASRIARLVWLTTHEACVGNPLTLETVFPGVYAIGEVTSFGTPNAGGFAEGQAAVVAERIAARAREEVGAAEYDGRGVCYAEFGGDRVGVVDVTFRARHAPGIQPSTVSPASVTTAGARCCGTARSRS